MREWLTIGTGHAVTITVAMALVIVSIGTVQAFIRSVLALFKPANARAEFHSIYVQYARWLVGGLTFQLAADILESSILPTWDEVGRLGAVAVIRTFLNYFLERDLAEGERREAELKKAMVESP